MSGQHLVGRVYEFGRATRKQPSPGLRWARRIAVSAAVALFATPNSAGAQSFWRWGPADYYYQPRPYYHPRPYYGPDPYYETRPARPKRPKIRRKDPAEAAAKKAPKPVGPLVIAVSVAKQRVKVYDSNGLFAEAPVSTGTRSHPTPYGVFSIIQKNRHHVSNLYGASMPYMQRITWSGVAMHTGPLPGYAASHGCIRLPNDFAARLWTWTTMGTRVIVAPDEVTPSDFSHPKLIARMGPLPTFSTAPAQAQVVAADSNGAAITEQRTADARDAIAGMKGTLTDVAPAAPIPAGDIGVLADAKRVGIGTAGEAPASVSGDKPVATVAQAPLSKSADTDPLAVKPQDRVNTDESAPAAQEPANANEASRPSEAAPTASKPADIVKPAEVAAPVTTPEEPARPAVVAAPRRHNHVAIFISRKDKKLYIRHGYEPIYDTPVEIADPDRPLGTHVFTARGDKDDAKALRWTVVSLPQIVRRPASRRASRQGARRPTPAHSNVTPPLNASEALDRVAIPAEAMQKIASIISPGGSLLISDHGINGWETGKGTDFIVPLR